ncbi:MAG: hypothetical protein E4H05_11190 [Acidimicrobiales bacterium]|nr:MAG: hypothetical protein E4H05_11190 [Acidimicrobiales bacterium]
MGQSGFERVVDSDRDRIVRVVDGKFVTTVVSSDVEAIGSGADASDSASFLQSFLSDFPVNNATFTCDGEDLVVDFPAVGTTASVWMVPA